MSDKILKIYDPVEVDDDFFDANEEEANLFYSKVRSLPEPILDILFGTDTSEIIRIILTAFNLSAEQSASISRLVRYVLVSDIYIGDIPAEISKRAGVDQNTAKEIARKIVSELFVPAIEDIKKMQLAKFGKLPGLASVQANTTIQPPQHTMPKPAVPGEELPETGGNIIDLRNQS